MFASAVLPSLVGLQNTGSPLLYLSFSSSSSSTPYFFLKVPSGSYFFRISSHMSEWFNCTNAITFPACFFCISLHLIHSVSSASRIVSETNHSRNNRMLENETAYFSLVGCCSARWQHRCI